MPQIWGLLAGAVAAWLLWQQSQSSSDPTVTVVSMSGNSAVWGRDAILATADAAGRRWGVPVGMMSRLVIAESDCDPAALSPKGARGVCQIMPATWDDFVRRGWVGSAVDPWSIGPACDVAARYLASMAGDGWLAAAASYNWGPGNVSGSDPATWPSGVLAYARQVSGVL
jgi:soluble lytic murein transglycosylase-like protein